LKLALLIVIPLLLLIALAGGAAFYFNDGEEQGTIAQFEPAELGELVVSVTAPGEIEADTSVNISAKTSAQILELPFEEGESVAAGDVLVRLDDTNANARLRAARAGRTQAAANLKVAEARIVAGQARQAVNEALLAEAERDLERQQSLVTSGDVSQKIADEAQTRVQRLRAEVATERLSLEADQANLAVLEALIDAAEAEIERATQEVEDTTIRSPIDGVVTKLNAEVGEIVVTGTMNNAGTVIMEVADLNAMICTAEVDEASIAQVEVGQTAIVRSPAYGDDEKLMGTVRSVALAKSTGMGDGAGSDFYEVEVLLDADSIRDVRVFSGLTADVEIETQRLEDVLRVPSQAVVGRRVDELPPELRSAPQIRSGREFTPVVYRVIDGVAKVTPVEVGQSDLLNTQILSGLEPGEPVIVGPFKVLESVREGEGIREEEGTGQKEQAPTE
jgi:HlyD family secretion protein